MATAVVAFGDLSTSYPTLTQTATALTYASDLSTSYPEGAQISALVANEATSYPALDYATEALSYETVSSSSYPGSVSITAVCAYAVQATSFPDLTYTETNLGPLNLLASTSFPGQGVTPSEATAVGYEDAYVLGYLASLGYTTYASGGGGPAPPTTGQLFPLGQF